jgi:hypothetical protein
MSKMLSRFALLSTTMLVLGACGQSQSPTPDSPDSQVGAQAVRPICPDPLLERQAGTMNALRLPIDCVNPLPQPPRDPGVVLAASTRILAPNAGVIQAYDEASGTLTLPINSVTSAYVPGTILVGGITASTPVGVRPSKVVSVATSGGNLVVTTVPASLEEAVSDGTISEERQLSAADVVEELITPQGMNVLKGQSLTSALAFNCKKGGSAGISKNFSKHLDDTTTTWNNGSTGLSMDIEGCVRADLALKLNLSIKKFKLQSFEASVKLTEEAELAFKTTGSASYGKEWELGRVKFASMTFFLGPVPVVVSPFVAFIVGVEGNVTASLSYKVTQDLTYKVGIGYTRADGMKKINEKEFHFDLPEKDFVNVNLAASAKAYVGLKAGINFWSTVILATADGDLYGVVRGFGKASIDTSRTPLWRLTAGMQFCYGYKLSLDLLFGLVSKSWDGSQCGREYDLWSIDSNGKVGNVVPGVINPLDPVFNVYNNISFSVNGSIKTSARISKVEFNGTSTYITAFGGSGTLDLTRYVGNNENAVFIIEATVPKCNPAVGGVGQCEYLGISFKGDGKIIGSGGASCFDCANPTTTLIYTINKTAGTLYYGHRGPHVGAFSKTMLYFTGGQVEIHRIDFAGIRTEIPRFGGNGQPFSFDLTPYLDGKTETQFIVGSVSHNCGLFGTNDCREIDMNVVADGQSVYDPASVSCGGCGSADVYTFTIDQPKGTITAK